MNSLALILIVAAVGFGISRWSRLPVIPLLLVAGLIMSVLGFISPDTFTTNVFELGLAFLVFTAGIELNPRRFGPQLKAVIWVGLVQFVLVGVCSFILARYLLNFEAMTAAYLAITVSTSSTLVVINHLKQERQLFEPFGRLVIGVLLFQDLLMILILVVLSHFPSGGLAVGKGLAGVFALSGLAIGCQRWLLPMVLTRWGLDEESILLTILALLFTFLGLANLLDLPPVVGAFLAGFALANFPVNGVVRGLLLSLSDFFQAIFFTALGSLIVVPDLELLAVALILTLVVLVLTPPLVTFLAEWAGLNSRSAVESGILLAQTSEFALVIGLTASQELKQISPEVFSVISLVTVITMSLTPLLARDQVVNWLLHFHPGRRRMDEQGQYEDHVLILGFGAGGMWVVKPLMAAGHKVLVVDDDTVVIQQLRKIKIPCLRGDGSDPKVLNRAGASKCKLVLASMRRVSEAERVLHHVQDIPVMVRVFEKADAEHIRKKGGIPILNSEAASQTFMEWFNKIHGGNG